MTDPGATASEVIACAEALLVDVRQARMALAATAESPERSVYLSMLESLERGLLAALEDVVAELKDAAGRSRGGGLVAAAVEEDGMTQP